MTPNSTLADPRVAPAHPPELADALGRVARLLDAGDPVAALAVASDGNSPWLVNARGVCLLRLGKPERAADALRGLVFDRSGLTVRADAPPLFMANYATALLLAGNADGFRGILGDIRDRGHPAVRRLTDAVRRWRAGFTWREWVWSHLGSTPRPLALDFPPGSL